MNIQRLFKNKYFPRFAFVAVGAVAGYAYYHFVGCATGSCPITGNPYISTLYGGLMGFLLGSIKEG